jgi:hypothetical protein
MNPPMVALVTSPSAHRTRSTTAIVHNIRFLSSDWCFVMSRLKGYMRGESSAMGCSPQRSGPTASIIAPRGRKLAERSMLIRTAPWCSQPMIELIFPGSD